MCRLADIRVEIRDLVGGCRDDGSTRRAASDGNAVERWLRGDGDDMARHHDCHRGETIPPKTSGGLVV